MDTDLRFKGVKYVLAPNGTLYTFKINHALAKSLEDTILPRGFNRIESRHQQDGKIFT